MSFANRCARSTGIQPSSPRPRGPGGRGRHSETRSRRCAAGRPERSAGRTPTAPRYRARARPARRGRRASVRPGSPLGCTRARASCIGPGAALNTSACSLTSRKYSDPHGATATTSTSAIETNRIPCKAARRATAPPMSGDDVRSCQLPQRDEVGEQCSLDVERDRVLRPLGGTVRSRACPTNARCSPADAAERSCYRYDDHGVP